MKDAPTPMTTAVKNTRHAKTKRVRKPKRARSIGITALLSVTIAGLVLLSVSSVLVLSSQSAWQSTRELLRAQAELAMTLVEEEIRNHISPALEISRYIHAQVAAGQIYPGNPKELIAVFKGALAAAPQIAGVVLWDKDYNRMEIRRSESGRVSVSADAEEVTPALTEYVEGIRLSGAPLWGPPTEGDEEANYVNAHTPLDYRGRHWGVMATGVTINNLSAIVKRIGDARGMTAFILYGDNVLAHPALADAPVRLGEDGFARLLTIEELGDPIIAQFYQTEFVTPPGAAFQYREMDDDAGDEFLVLSRVNTEFGDTPWHIGIYGLARDWGKQFRRLVTSVVAGVVVLLLAFGCALWIARKISRPIRKLADTAEQIGMLELANVGDIAPSKIKELDEQAGAFNRMVDGLKWFETYVPKRLVRQLIHSRDDASSVASNEVELSVMFTDIIGFTALSETMQPGEVGDLVNAHFEIIARCIEAHGGTLDKYIGDSVMAFWGAPEAQPDHAERACRAALAIADELAQASSPGAAHDPPVRIKIAIHSGTLLVGNIGASSRMNYTVIGDTVNTCSRIESLCAQFDNGAPAIILVSADTAQLAQPDPTLHFEEVGEYEVKGRSGEVRVCRLRWKGESA